MDSNHVDEDEESAAMAAIMGFSGFGSHKPAAKKRKFTTDAFVEGQEPPDKGGKKGQGSGGNTMPLGKTRVFGTAPASETVQLVAVNALENSLDDDDDNDDVEEVGGPQYVDTSLPPPILSGEDGPRYMDMSQPSLAAAVSDEEAKEMRSRIDAILASGESREPDPAFLTDIQLPRPQGLPQRPSLNPPNTLSNSGFMRGGPRNAFSDSALVGSSRISHRGGSKNEKWYLDYYDPSFNENPWARLEKEKGLEPLGKWPEIQRLR